MMSLKAVLDADRNAYLAAKERAADLKKRFEAARSEYEDAIDTRKKYRGQKPPGVQLTFDDVKPAAEPTASTPAAAGNAPGWFPDDLWKKYPIARFVDLGLTQRDVEILHEGEIKDGGGKRNPIVHYGDVAAFTSPKGSGFSHKLTDLKGFGPQAYERFENAQSKFWAEWPGELSERFAKELGYFPDKPRAAEHKPKPQTKKAKKGNGKPDATVKGGGKRTTGSGGNGRASGGADQPGDADAAPAATIPFEQPQAADETPSAEAAV